MILCSNPRAGYLACKDEIDRAVLRVLEKGRYILGEEVAAFENEFAGYCGARYGIGVSNGTDAIHLTLRALDIGPGDEVITVSNTAVATVAAIVQSGATPVFVDIDERSFTMDVRKVGRKITKKTRAIICVHLYGHPCDIDPLLDVSAQYNIRLIEDCAQAHGAEYKGAKAGSSGIAGCFSFYPTKNLGCFGDGGLIITNDDALASRLKIIREYGWQERYVSSVHGYNSRLDELQAAILRVKLKYLDQNIRKRNEIAKKYLEGISNENIILPVTGENCLHAFHLFVARTPDRDRLIDFLKKKEINALVHYPVPVHQQPAYAGISGQDLPVTERSAMEVLSLPMYPELGDDDLNHVIESINQYE